MAGQKSFATLRNHATKVIKYKQSKVTNNEEVFFAQINASMQGLSHEIQGLCAALTMAFLGDMLKALRAGGAELTEIFAADALTRFKRDATVGAASSVNSQNIAAKIVVPMQTYVKAVTSGDKAAFDKLAAGEGMRPTVELISPDRVDASFLKNAHHWIVRGTAYYFSLQLKDKAAGHGVGVVRGSAGLYFFDPNVGGYCIQDDKLNDFSAEYLGVLVTGGWIVTEAIVRKYELP